MDSLEIMRDEEPAPPLATMALWLCLPLLFALPTEVVAAVADTDDLSLGALLHRDLLDVERCRCERC
jgi:hypothetical protein